MKISTIFLLFQLCLNLTAFSQQIDSTTFVKTKTIKIGNDTLVLLTVEQTKFLLKKVYEVEELKELNSDCELEVLLYDSTVKSNENVIEFQQEIIKNDNEIIQLKNYEIKKLNDQIETERKQTRKQKFYKWVAITVGAFGTSFMTYKYVTK